MNRIEFMTKLEALLFGISSEEREEALQYYQDYFEDAGTENESKVIQELGSPEKVAATILADLRGADADAGEFTERGFTDERFEQKDTPVRYGEKINTENLGNGYSYSGYEQNHTGDKKPWSNKWVKIALIVLIVIVGAPIAFPIAIALIAAVIGIVVGVFALFIGLVIAAIGLVIAGIGVVVSGLFHLLSSTPAAIAAIGVGLLLLVVGVIATVGTVRLCLVMFPAIMRILVELCRKPFQKKGAL